MISLQHVSKSFGPNRVLTDISLTAAAGEFIAIVGYSGSGKSTLMNLMAGLQKPDSGSLTMDGQPISGPGPERGLVFQNYSLLPWLTVRQNIALAVDQVFGRESSQDRARRIDEAIAMVKLTPAAGKLPRELSGGMRQRVAVARTIATKPKVLLLDEPLSALDALTRSVLQDQILSIRKQTGQTIILITNDVDEALYMADRIIPLSTGPGATFGPEETVPAPHPRNRAELIRTPEMRSVRTRLVDYLLNQRRLDIPVDASTPLPPDMWPIDITEVRPVFNIRRLRTAQAERDSLRAAGVRQPLTMAPASAPEQPIMEISRLGKSFGNQEIVHEFNLRVKRGEFVSIIGHSGCGKSTVLSMVAGLLESSGGGMILDHREITGAGPDRGMVFQSPCLLPWMSALENVMLGVKQVYYHRSHRERLDLCVHFLGLLGLTDSMHKKPGELSQGMRQRVGLARAFALQPKVLLLDEPFGMLDKLTKFELQDVLLDLRGRTGTTALMVTHDVDEAIYLSDRVVMMSDGPSATVAEILTIEFARPRDRQSLLADPAWHDYRSHLLSFLEERADYRGHTREYIRSEVPLLSLGQRATA
ncbi:MAG: nitrate transporter, ATPase subunit [Verrucomicrobiales bacterium]|nr:nitrate transporter, ATPase subunit [Verrucomicrobiales bacterium]